MSFRFTEKSIRRKYQQTFDDRVQDKLDEIEDTLKLGQNHEALSVEQLIEHAGESNSHMRQLLMETWQTRTFSTIGASLIDAIQSDLAELLDTNDMIETAARLVNEDMNDDIDYAADQAYNAMRDEAHFG